MNYKELINVAAHVTVVAGLLSPVQSSVANYGTLVPSTTCNACPHASIVYTVLRLLPEREYNKLLSYESFARQPYANLPRHKDWK